MELKESKVIDIIKNEVKQFLNEQAMNYPPQGAGVPGQDKKLKNDSYLELKYNILNARKFDDAFNAARDGGWGNFSWWDPGKNKFTQHTTRRADETPEDFAVGLEGRKMRWCAQNPDACNVHSKYMPDNIKARKKYLERLEDRQDGDYLKNEMARIQSITDARKRIRDWREQQADAEKQGFKVKPINENKSLRNLQKLLREVIVEEHASSEPESRVIKEYFKRNDFITAFDKRIDATKPNFAYESSEEEAFSPKLDIFSTKPVLGEGPIEEKSWPVNIEEEDVIEEDTSQRFKDTHERFFDDVEKRFRSISPSAYRKVNFLETDEGLKMDMRNLSTADKMLARKAYYDAWKSLGDDDRNILEI